MRRHGEAEEAAAVARVDRGPVHVQTEAGHRDGEQQAAGQPRHGGHGHVSRVSLGASGPHPAAVRCSVSDKSVAAAAMASVDTGRRSWGGLQGAGVCTGESLGTGTRGQAGPQSSAPQPHFPLSLTRLKIYFQFRTIKIST